MRRIARVPGAVRATAPPYRLGVSSRTAETSFENAAQVARWVAETSMLFNDADSPFRAEVADGAPELVVVTGENASGKSLYVRVAGAVVQKDMGALPVSVSIRERTGAGTSEMGGMRRVMMFGDEQEQSTGATSVSVVQKAFGNLDRPNGSVLIVDEPELGLAEAYARALGEYIGQQAQGIPAACRGVIVVTHSRPLVQGLIDGYGQTPTHAAVNADTPAHAGLQRWLDSVEHRTVEELLALRDVGLGRWRRVNTLLKD